MGNPKARRRTLVVLFAATVVTLLVRPASPQPPLPSGDVLLAEAKRLFSALDYERAVPELDRAIEQLQARLPEEPALRPSLAAALEMRARAHFGLGEGDQARADFRALLTLDPGHAFSDRVSPKVVALLEEIRKATVGKIVLNLSPSDAVLQLDGAPFTAAAGPIPIGAGPHAIQASRTGYRPATQSFTVAAGTTQEIALTLERVSSVVEVVTLPPEVEVVADGVSRGRTVAGGASPDYAESAARLGVAPQSLSRSLVLTDLAPGPHLLEFRRDCYVRAERRIQIDKPADYRLDPIKLDPSVGSVYVDARVPGATVFLDGSSKGPAPLSLDAVCEGPHLVELRSPHGRFQRRVDVRTGDKLSVEGDLKPAFALLSASGVAEGVRGATDVRLEIERALAAARLVTVLAVPGDLADRTLQAERLTAGWLSFDRTRRPLGPAAGNITESARREISARLARALEVQGVAELAVAPGEGRRRLYLCLLAAGSGQPDVLEIAPDDPDSVRATLSRLDDMPQLFRPSAGLLAIDVLDVPGAIVAAVQPGGQAAAAGLAPGDAIVRVAGQPVNDAATFATVLASRKAGDRLPLEVRDRTGAAKRVEIPIVQAPRLSSMADETLLFNTLILSLRSRLVGARDPMEESVTRLNLAAALIRAGDWAGASAELDRVKLPDGAGVSNGTVQYLLGLCDEAMGQASDAERHFRAASTAQEALLTEDGPAIKELAERKLADLKRRQ